MQNGDLSLWVKTKPYQGCPIYAIPHDRATSHGSLFKVLLGFQKSVISHFQLIAEQVEGLLGLSGRVIAFVEVILGGLEQFWPAPQLIYHVVIQGLLLEVPRKGVKFCLLILLQHGKLLPKGAAVHYLIHAIV